MSSWHSYPSIFNLGHKAIQDLFSVPCYIEEKIDGSQFSFGIFTIEDPSNAYSTVTVRGQEYEFRVRSKGAIMNPDAPEKMFSRAVESVRERVDLLHPDWTYRGEYLMKPKHNSLAYSRTPNGHLILFDIHTGDQEYLSYNDKLNFATAVGYECVPLIAQTIAAPSVETLRGWLDKESCLGGQKIEGVVIKQQQPLLYGHDKKVLMGKFVSEAFREVHKREWKDNNPTQSDVIKRVADEFCTPARWNKAIQHLKEQGKLEGSPRDIGTIMKEIPLDVEKECREEIMEHLWKYFWPHICRMTTVGFPEYYKEQLMREQLNKEA